MRTVGIKKIELIKLKSLKTAARYLKDVPYLFARFYDLRELHKNRKFYLFHDNAGAVYLTDESHLLEMHIVNWVSTRLMKLVMQHSPSTAILNILASPNRTKLLDQMIFYGYLDIRDALYVISPGLIANPQRLKYYNWMWRYLEHKVWINSEDSQIQIIPERDVDGFQRFYLCKGEIRLASIMGDRELIGPGSFGFDVPDALLKLQDYQLLSREDLRLLISKIRALSHLYVSHPLPYNPNDMANYMTRLAKKYHEIIGTDVLTANELVSPDKIKLMLDVVGLT